jgi:hypothetical protein
VLRSAVTIDRSGRRGSVDRSEYLIDSFRVGYEFGGGWRCGCAEFASRDSCKHTREAAGRHAAQSRIAEHLKRGSAEAFFFSEPPVTPAESITSAGRQML